MDGARKHLSKPFEAAFRVANSEVVQAALVGLDLLGCRLAGVRAVGPADGLRRRADDATTQGRIHHLATKAFRVADVLRLSRQLGDVPASTRFLQARHAVDVGFQGEGRHALPALDDVRRAFKKLGVHRISKMLRPQELRHPVVR